MYVSGCSQPHLAAWRTARVDTLTLQYNQSTAVNGWGACSQRLGCQGCGWRTLFLRVTTQFGSESEELLLELGCGSEVEKENTKGVKL